MNRYLFVILFTLVAGVATPRHARAIVLQPAEADSKDTFGYQFLPNLPTGNFNSPPFNAFLPAGKTGTGHDTESILQFDLSGVGLTAAEVTSATLELFVVDTATTGFGQSPTGANPVTVNLLSLTGAWDESTVTWGTFPGTGSQYAQAVVNGINQTVSFDVTTLVHQWLNGTLANNGLLLRGDSVVGSSPNFVVATFSASAGSVAPKLTVVPEPASIVLAASAVAAIAWIGGRGILGRKRLK